MLYYSNPLLLASALTLIVTFAASAETFQLSEGLRDDLLLNRRQGTVNGYGQNCTDSFGPTYQPCGTGCYNPAVMQLCCGCESYYCFKGELCSGNRTCQIDFERKGGADNATATATCNFPTSLSTSGGGRSSTTLMIDSTLGDTRSTTGGATGIGAATGVSSSTAVASSTTTTGASSLTAVASPTPNRAASKALTTKPLDWRLVVGFFPVLLIV